MKASTKLKIKSLKVQLDKIQADAKAATLPVQVALEKEFDAVYGASKELKAAIDAVESSVKYAFNECGDLMRWNSVESLDALSQGDLDQLDRYLSDQGITLDRVNSCLMVFEGDFIAIDDEGEIALNECGRWTSIAKASDYATTAERNALIEAFMESKEYYPTVIVMDRYGNARAVNTQRQSA